MLYQRLQFALLTQIVLSQQLGSLVQPVYLSPQIHLSTLNVLSQHAVSLTYLQRPFAERLRFVGRRFSQLLEGGEDGVGLGLLGGVGGGGLAEGGVPVGAAELGEGIGVAVGFIDLPAGTAPVHGILLILSRL